MRLVNNKKQIGSAAGLRQGTSVPRLSEDAAAPRYEAVKRLITEAILMGQWPPGTLLPAEVALARMFGVAVGTVRRALVDLSAEGLLSRRRRTGTVVTGRSPHHSLRFFFQYFRLHAADGALVRSRARMLSLEIGPTNEAERASLHLDSEAEVVRLHRTRSIDGRPIMHDRFILPAARLPDFPRKLNDVPELLYLHLLERYGIRVSAVREQLTADLANEEDVALLCLSPPAAVLTIEEIAYDQAGAPMIIATHRATTQAHCYINEIR